MLLPDAERYPLDPSPVCVSSEEVQSTFEWSYSMMTPIMCGAVCSGMRAQYFAIIKVSLSCSLLRLL